MTTVRLGAPAALNYVDPDAFTINSAVVVQASATRIVIRESVSFGHVNGTVDVTLTGNFTFDSGGGLTGGALHGLNITYNGSPFYEFSDFATPVNSFLAYAEAGDIWGFVTTLLGGADSISGSSWDETLPGLGGADTITGGAGDDTIDGGDGVSYLRGDEGNDSIAGGSAFDDINGNMGNDTASGGAGGDWVVGGKDQDRLFGDDGNDIVYGNLGADTCDGGAGADIVRGGQDDDVITGGAGDDWLSGDRGSDTVSGGAGADVFHTFGDADLDRVTDFDRASGDRVMVDPGTIYTVAQSGADTVISMAGGGQMVLVNVQASSLNAGWIFGA